MEINELKQIVKENFEDKFDKKEYKLKYVGCDESIKHVHYMVVSDNTPYIWFSVAKTGLYKAVSTEILSSAYDTNLWYSFLKSLNETLMKRWVSDNA